MNSKYTHFKIKQLTFKVLLVFTWRHDGHVEVLLTKEFWLFLLFETPTWPLCLLSFVSLGIEWKPRIPCLAEIKIRKDSAQKCYTELFSPWWIRKHIALSHICLGINGYKRVDLIWFTIYWSHIIKYLSKMCFSDERPWYIFIESFFLQCCQLPHKSLLLSLSLHMVLRYFVRRYLFTTNRSFESFWNWQLVYGFSRDWYCLNTCSALI